MTDDTKEFIAMINSLGRKELLEYDQASKTAGNMIGFFAVTILLITLIFANIVTIAICGVLVYHLAKLSTGISHSRKLLSDRLVQMNEDK